MKNKLYAFAIILLLITSVRLVAVGGEAIEEEDKVEVPEWNEGYQWRYREKIPMPEYGNLETEFEKEVTDENVAISFHIEDEEEETYETYEVRETHNPDDPEEKVEIDSYHWKENLAEIYNDPEDTLSSAYHPPIVELDFPLYVGKEWEGEARYFEDLGDPEEEPEPDREYEYMGKVENRTVKEIDIGEFETYMVNLTVTACDENETQINRYEMYYSPEAKNVVHTDFFESRIVPDDEEDDEYIEEWIGEKTLIDYNFADVDEIPDLFLEEYSFTNSAPSTLHRILEFIDLYDLQLSGEFEAEFSDPDMIDSAELELELEYFKPIEGGWESPRETYHETQYFNLEKEGDEWLCEIEVGSWYPGGPLALLVSILTKEHWVPGWVIPVIGIEQVYTGAEITEIEVNTIDGQKEVMEVEESIKTSHEKAWEAYKEDNNEIVMMGSPATVMIESEEGRLGSDGDETYEEIDGYYSGMDSEVQLIGLPTPGKDYDVSIYGTEDGEYNLNVGSIREGDYEEIIMEENEEISEGEEKNWEINTPDDLEDEDEVDWLPYMGIGIVGLIVLVIAVILVKKRGKSESSREEEYYQRESTSRNQSSRVPQQSKGPPAQETSEQNLCRDCGGEMRYIEEYDSWYCDKCQQYK